MKWIPGLLLSASMCGCAAIHPHESVVAEINRQIPGVNAALVRRGMDGSAIGMVHRVKFSPYQDSVLGLDRNGQVVLDLCEEMDGSYAYDANRHFSSSDSGESREETTIRIDRAMLPAALTDDGTPQSIRRTVREDGSHEYRIARLMIGGASAEALEFIEGDLPQMMSGIASISISADSGDAIIVPERPMPTLRPMVNWMARIGCAFYWAEFIARDRYSPGFDHERFRMVIRKELEVMEYEAVRMSGKWRRLDSEEPASMPLRYAPGRRGTLEFKRYMKFCMSCDRYSMRIADESGLWIWENVDEVFDTSLIRVSDENRDGVDEIHVLRNDHGTHFHLLRWDVSRGEEHERP
jgi:hypothetical protein